MASTNAEHPNGVDGVNGANGHTNLPALAHSASEFLDEQYDFVIVGGGTAGLVVAARLTEDPNIRVGVLEAGPNRLGDPMVDIPAMFTQMLGNKEYDHIFYTEAQKHNQGKVHQHPRGKMLGGSSGINYMMYVRGSSADYDDWATLVDDPTWSSKNMKHYMRKHQTLEPIDPRLKRTDTMPFVGENHGTDGPVRTSFNGNILPIEHNIIDAADEVTGLAKKPLDPFSGDHIGFYNTLGSVCRTGPNKGKRSYAARGYFEANAQRPNLKVLCDATVTKVLLEGDIATGVEFHHGGQTHVVKPQKDIIVSGGTYHSPQILELSGIGDPDVLSAAGVECKVKLQAVGSHLNEHALTVTGHELKPGHLSLDAVYQPGGLEAVQKQLIESQDGSLTEISSMQGFFPYKMFASKEAMAETIKLMDEGGADEFEKRQLQISAQNLQRDDSANLQLVAVLARPNTKEGIENQSRLFAPPDSLDMPFGITLAICGQYLASRGYVHIKSNDPYQHPKIDPRYLSNEADINVLATGLQFLDKVAKSPHLADKLLRRIFPREELDLSNFEDAKQAVREWVMTEYHPCGTCAIGEVVDSRLKVKGVKRLRVIDASIFPNHVSGNINSSVYSVAEKGADLVKEDWGIAEYAKRGKDSPVV
ncbi:GMC oxidoreductase [Myriangium duriaei CBS 260.36]|uniref:GMC oxidoreductase n=1 Tax=Myriangium duriaei CBS 260.36 TaxID=1168546 RepID=A0A9P4IT02_9PEZI|nr:GMC oxidoreductase [Myriangium duriaei CBS 260.36]